MKIKVTRTNSQQLQEEKEYDIQTCKKTVLGALEYIKEEIDSSLSYRCGCKSGVCGSCAIRVNGQEKLACKTSLKENDRISALQYMPIIKDLVVDLHHEEKVLKKSKTYLNRFKEEKITIQDNEKIETQSNCILCQSCYSSCPVFEVNKNFLGPYALTRALRYTNDKKESEGTTIINAVQSNGIWDCTLCGNCTMVCPQFIDPKSDIMQLRMLSVQAGHKDPNMENFGCINNEFNNSFNPTGGFDPNGF